LTFAKFDLEFMVSGKWDTTERSCGREPAYGGDCGNGSSNKKPGL